MIKLVGTAHELVGTGILQEIVSKERYDHLFVEGIDSETQKEIEKLLNEDRPETLDLPPKRHEQWEADVNQALEPEFVERSPLLSDDEVTFLDNEPLEHAKVLLSEDEAGTEKDQIGKKEFKERLENGPERDDYIEYFRHLSDISFYDLLSVSLSDPDRFRHFLNDFATGFVKIDENGEKEPFYARYFFRKAEEHDIDRFDLQQTIYDHRRDFQDERDQRWYDTISGYLEENPEDDILVIAGINHVVDGENSVRRLLEDEYGEVEAHPLDHYF